LGRCLGDTRVLVASLAAQFTTSLPAMPLCPEAQMKGTPQFGVLDKVVCGFAEPEGAKN